MRQSLLYLGERVCLPVTFHELKSSWFSHVDLNIPAITHPYGVGGERNHFSPMHAQVTSSGNMLDKLDMIENHFIWTCGWTLLVFRSDGPWLYDKNITKIWKGM
jgi:hypothetical protein